MFENKGLGFQCYANRVKLLRVVNLTPPLEEPHILVDKYLATHPQS